MYYVMFSVGILPQVVNWQPDQRSILRRLSETKESLITLSYLRRQVPSVFMSFRAAGFLPSQEWRQFLR